MTHFWSDLTVGQVLTAVIAVFGAVNVIGTGALLKNGRATLRGLRRLVASVGHLPEDQDHRAGQTLTAQVDRLASEWEFFREKYKLDQDNIRAQQIRQQTGLPHDEPPVRDRIEDAAEAWRDGY